MMWCACEACPSVIEWLACSSASNGSMGRSGKLALPAVLRLLADGLGPVVAERCTRWGAGCTGCCCADMLLAPCCCCSKACTAAPYERRDTSLSRPPLSRFGPLSRSETMPPSGRSPSPDPVCMEVGAVPGWVLPAPHPDGSSALVACSVLVAKLLRRAWVAESQE